MEKLGAAAGRSRHHRHAPPSDRFLEPFRHHLPPTSPSYPLELSEQDIFNSSPSTSSSTNSGATPDRSCPNQTGILAAINDNQTRSVFNHRPSLSRMMVPRKPPPPPADRLRLRNQSAPVSVPVMIRRARDFDDVDSDEEEESEGVVLPPHMVVAARESPALANSVQEGKGRTLKGRDLRQVRNAVWRKTGFLD